MQKAELRFWNNVERRGDNECWPWHGSKVPTGYGKLLNESGQQEYAHRFAWRLVHGPIPNGLDICHSCDNPACCNPAHLWAGTAKENIRDSVQKGRWHRLHKYNKAVSNAT